jgi:uncharacterized Zn finger protein
MEGFGEAAVPPVNREWWAQRWIDVLESFGWVRRLARARIYAREGNVLSLEFKGEKVTALVQGTAPQPYQVKLSLDPFSDEQWDYIVESMAERAIFSAKLLAGEMPPTIEQAFTANGLSLFPFNKFDIHSRCSCPDPANPCKHIGAVYYVLGDRFSEDPFVLFQLRGRTQGQIVEALRQRRRVQDDPIVPPDPPIPASPALPLEAFWHYPTQLDASLVVIAPAPTQETVLDLLGPLPPWSEAGHSAAQAKTLNQAALVYLQQIYQAASQYGILTGMAAQD